MAPNFRCFYFTTDFNYCFSDAFISPTFFTMTMSGTSLYVVVPWVLRIWKNFFYSQAFFTLLSFPTFGTTGCCTSLHLSRLPWEPAVLPWRLQDLRLSFETQTQPICLFESHSVKQKVLVDRFYLCVKALRNTISTSSRFWTHNLKAIYNTKHLCYLLGHRSS